MPWGTLIRHRSASLHSLARESPPTSIPEEAIHQLKEKLLKATLSNSDNIRALIQTPLPYEPAHAVEGNSFVLEFSTLSAPAATIRRGRVAAEKTKANFPICLGGPIRASELFSEMKTIQGTQESVLFCNEMRVRGF